MATSKVLPIKRFRGRRDRRREKTIALHATDHDRIRVLHLLWRALDLSGADRAAAVWVDEYGSGLVHPYAVLDVGSDDPRRTFSMDLVRRTWRQGVPGVMDVPGQEPSLALGAAGTGRSAFAVSLGSDGLKAWFVVLDSPLSRAPFDPDLVEDLLFLAGECAGILLHRDLAGDAFDGEDDREGRFTAWPVLRDAPDDEPAAEHVTMDAGAEATARGRRIACRFVVARAVRALLEEELVMTAEEREERVLGVVREIDRFPGEAWGDDVERRAWERVVRALREDDPRGLARSVHDVGLAAEDLGHWHGAAELYRTAREVAAASGLEDVWLDATRVLGRVHRKMGAWDEATHWYQVAREGAGTVGALGLQARAMDGLATVHIMRGRIPAARETVAEALPVAVASGDPDVHASVLHSFMTIAHTEGRLVEAARYGWQAVNGYRTDESGRLRTLTALAGVFLEARELDSAEDAFAIVVSRQPDQVIRLYALAGLALVAAHRGRPELYRRRLDDLERAGFSSGTAALRAEVLLECGDGFLALGDEDEARVWYQRALGLSEHHGLNEFTIRADEAIERLDRVTGDVPDAHEAAPASAAPGEPELEEIRSGLSRMRRREGVLA